MGPGSRPGRHEESYVSFILPLVPPREIVGHVGGNLVLELRRALFQERHHAFFHVLGAAAGVDAAFFFNDTATTEIYTLSLHDALPIYQDVDPAEVFLHGRDSGLDL